MAKKTTNQLQQSTTDSGSVFSSTSTASSLRCFQLVFRDEVENVAALNQAGASATRPTFVQLANQAGAMVRKALNGVNPPLVLRCERGTITGQGDLDSLLYSPSMENVEVLRIKVSVDRDHPKYAEYESLLEDEQRSSANGSRRGGDLEDEDEDEDDRGTIPAFDDLSSLAGSAKGHADIMDTATESLLGRPMHQLPTDHFMRPVQFSAPFVSAEHLRSASSRDTTTKKPMPPRPAAPPAPATSTKKQSPPPPLTGTKKPDTAQVASPPEPNQKHSGALMKLLTNSDNVAALDKFINSSEMKPVLDELSQAVVHVLAKNASTILAAFAKGLQEAPSSVRESLFADGFGILEPFIEAAKSSATGGQPQQEEEKMEEAKSGGDSPSAVAPSYTAVPTVDPYQPAVKSTMELTKSPSATSLSVGYQALAASSPPTLPRLQEEDIHGLLYEPLKAASSASILRNRASAPVDNNQPRYHLKSFASAPPMSKVTWNSDDRDEDADGEWYRHQPGADAALYKAEEEQDMYAPLTESSNHHAPHHALPQRNVQHKAQLLVVDESDTVVNVLDVAPEGFVNWHIKNTGEVAWPQHVLLLQTKGSFRTGMVHVEECVLPGHVALVRFPVRIEFEDETLGDIRVRPNEYEGTFQLYSQDDDDYFGDQFKLRLVVVMDNGLDRLSPPPLTSGSSQQPSSVGYTPMVPTSAHPHRHQNKNTRTQAETDQLIHDLAEMFNLDIPLVRDVLESEDGDGDRCADKLQDISSGAD